MPNRNERTGFPYGVLGSSSEEATWLIQSVFDEGRNLSFDEARVDLERNLCDLCSIEYQNEEEAKDAFDDCRVLSELRLPFKSRYYADGTLELADIVEDALECVSIYSEEDRYELQNNDTHYLISWLGGAPLLWVIDSRYVTGCRACSPCVPGAGDLDSPGDHALAHCPPPEDLDYVKAGFYEVWRINDDRSLTKVYGAQHVET